MGKIKISSIFSYKLDVSSQVAGAADVFRMGMYSGFYFVLEDNSIYISGLSCGLACELPAKL